MQWHSKDLVRDATLGHPRSVHVNTQQTVGQLQQAAADTDAQLLF